MTACALPRSISRVAPVLFVLLWSTGFIGAKLGLPDAPPFTFLALRIVIVASLLTLAAVFTGAPWPASLRQAGHVALAGMMVHGAYLAGVFAAIAHGMGAGMVALIVGLQPLITASFASRLFGEKVGVRQWGGLVLGLIGVGLVVSHKIGLEGGPQAAALAIVGLAGITGGTLYQKRYCGFMDLRTGAAIQYWATAIVMVGLAWMFEPMRVHWTGSFAFALSWLVLVLSIGAIFLLFLLIREGQAAKVASLFYLTPPVTAVMAWALFGEPLTPGVMIGFAVVAAGVWLARK